MPSDRLGGDAPCSDCGGDNIVWFTDSVLWNLAIRRPDEIDPILCVHCFVRRVEAQFKVVGWRLTIEAPLISIEQQESIHE